MYTIGKLSKNTGVTVRTLDYYDEIGLINPSSKTEGGHRLYSEKDVMQLERVLALKYMGFSLEQIKDILEKSTQPGRGPSRSSWNSSSGKRNACSFWNKHCFVSQPSAHASLQPWNKSAALHVVTGAIPVAAPLENLPVKT